ncbi:hypothetical protein AB434_0466 [Heyndrickxia coagulans]|uniref:Uncharacterized protein n=1 Tax=Heyndrickxia coagulans TaxID=1398 RepID=A0AAN0WAN4_HEYCO|nr:hypothetical protein SB48_HM08orf01084 [Heyndrickxia coagulans]AKN52871.1 hypothetical protein AB434_0466 [Heyndrickxia coagulans]
MYGRFFCQTDGRDLSFRGEFPGVFIRAIKRLVFSPPVSANGL